MKARVYIKENFGKQRMFVATGTFIYDGKRLFSGFLSRTDGSFEDWDMAEKVINAKMKNGTMTRIQ